MSKIIHYLQLVGLNLKCIDSKTADLIFAAIFVTIGSWDLLVGIFSLFKNSPLMALDDLLICGFYFLIAYFFATREDAQKMGTILESAVSIVSYCLPFFISFSGLYFSSDGEFTNVGQVFLISGLCITYLALLSLHKSVGIVPARRSIVTRGMYRFVRHPMYFGEIIMSIGIALIYLNFATISIVCVGFFALVLRIRWEERILSESADYVAYKQKIKYRLIPFIW